MRIFRYVVPVDDQWHRVTLQGSIRHIGSRDERVVEVWAAFRDDSPPNTRWLRVYGTGQDVPDEYVHIDTCVAPRGLVWHLFENPHIDPGDTPPVAEAVTQTVDRPRLAAA